MKASVYPDSAAPGMAVGSPVGIYTDSIHKFGFNPDVDTTTDPEDVWSEGGTITWPTAGQAEELQVWSTSANDTAAGTGAQTLTIQGVNTSFARISETLDLAGATTATASLSYLYVDRMFAATVGSTGTNEGIIRGSITNNIVANILANQGQTLQAAMVVPAYTGKTPYILNLWCGTGKATGAYADMILYRQPDGGAVRVQDRINTHSNSQGFFLQYTTPQALAAGDRLWWRVQEVSTNDMQCYGGFEIGWL